HVQHLGAADPLAVRISEHVGYAGAGSGNRWKPGLLDDAGAGDVPRVGQEEHAGSRVEPPQRFRLLTRHGSRLPDEPVSITAPRARAKSAAGLDLPLDLAEGRSASTERSEA